MLLIQVTKDPKRTDLAIAVNGVVLFRVEYKYQHTPGCEAVLETAKKQLIENTKWMKTLHNQTPFVFGIVTSQNCSRIYTLCPVKPEDEPTTSNVRKVPTNRNAMTLGLPRRLQIIYNSSYHGRLVNCLFGIESGY